MRALSSFGAFEQWGVLYSTGFDEGAQLTILRGTTLLYYLLSSKFLKLPLTKKNMIDERRARYVNFSRICTDQQVFLESRKITVFKRAEMFKKRFLISVRFCEDDAKLSSCIRAWNLCQYTSVKIADLFEKLFSSSSPGLLGQLLRDVQSFSWARRRILSGSITLFKNRANIYGEHVILNRGTCRLLQHPLFAYGSTLDCKYVNVSFV